MAGPLMKLFGYSFRILFFQNIPVSALSMFSCPDGKTFDNRKDWKKYMFETFYQFSGKSKETLVKNPGDIEGQVTC